MKKLLLILAATSAFAISVYAAEKNSVPMPTMSDVTATPVDTQTAPSKSYSGNSGAAAQCTPNAAIQPGTSFSPVIDDSVRVAAINDLLNRIANCKTLPYAHDGIINTNTEGHMPHEAAGYYKEYTLIVPGRNTGDGPVPVVIGGQQYMTGDMQSTRGPERIIIGKGNEIYYTMDHYAHFVKLTIVQ